MRALLPLLLCLAGPALAKGPKSGNSAVTRAAIAVDNARWDDAIKGLSKLKTDLAKGTVALQPDRHGKALLLLATAHRARSQEPDNRYPVSDLVEAVDASGACEALPGAEELHADCHAVGDDVGARLYVRLLKISEHGLDAPLTTDDLAAASDIRQALQRAEDGRIRPHLGEAWYRANTQAPKDADAAALAGLEVARAGTDEPQRALELAQLQARTRAFALGDVEGAVAALDLWKTALEGKADVSALDALSATLAASATRLQAALELAKAEPTNVDAQADYASLLDKMAQHRDAAAWWKHATETAPDVVELWFRRGVYHTNRAAFMQKGGAPYEALRLPLTDAAEAFDRCLALQPDHASCTKNKLTVANYLSQLNQTSEPSP